VDANEETHVALDARLGTAPSTLSTVIKYRKCTEKFYAQCRSFTGQRRSLKQSPFLEPESVLAAWFVEARGSSAIVSGTLMRERTQHIATKLGIGDFEASNGLISGFKQQQSAVNKAVRRVQKCTLLSGGGMEKGIVTTNYLGI
jgi:IS30 family transposase